MLYYFALLITLLALGGIAAWGFLNIFAWCPSFPKEYWHYKYVYAVSVILFFVGLWNGFYEACVAATLIGIAAFVPIARIHGREIVAKAHGITPE